MYINKHSKQIYKSSDDINSSKDTSSKNYTNKNNVFLPKLNEKEKNQTVHRRNFAYIENENSKTTYDEEIFIINTLWDELGITDEYKYYFNKLIKPFNSYYSNIILFQEKESLQKFKTTLIKLKKEISNRETNINKLKKIIKILDTEKEPNPNIIKEIVKIIKNLRLNAVNIVIYINRVRELSFYYYFQGKLDLTKMKNEYMYNNNYLLQMNNDLCFLKSSSISNYINFGNGPCDAFLINCSQLNENNNNKIIIPISDDLMQLIEQSIFFIFQDKILDNIYLKKFLNMNKTNNNNDENRSNSMKLKLNNYLNRPLTSKVFFPNNHCYKNFTRLKKKNMNINNFISDIDKRLLNNYKSGNISQNNNLFQIQAKLNEPKINLMPKSTRINERIKNPEEINSYKNIGDKKNIKIMHEIISPMNISNGQNKTYVDNKRFQKDNKIIKNELLKLNRKTGEKGKVKIIKSIFN